MINTRVIKRDGRIVKFDSNKILTAILKAMEAVLLLDEDLAKKITDDITIQVDGNKEISVEQIQDLVEDKLIELAPHKLAKEYILYRSQRKDVREYKTALGIEDELKLSPNALSLLEGRYLKNKETPTQMFKRTAKHISAIEKRYGDSPAKWNKVFYNMMSNKIFYPNIPTLSNSGIYGLNFLPSCYVLSVEDSMESIFSTAKDMALIFKSGGGVGLNLTNLRPRGDLVKTTGKVSSGVVGFLPVYDAVVESVKQGGMRRGAALGMIKCDHPDVVEFINCKKEKNCFNNFNLSIAITDKFMSCVLRDSEFSLVNPRNNERVGSIRARYLLNLIAKNAWETGDPGIVFFDTYNKNNPTPSLGDMYKNACGETSLLPNEACVLGSINLTKFYNENEISWSALSKTILNSIHFLDDIIDATDYVLPQIKEITLENRKIGLGVMGFADLLYLMKIPYNSEQAIEIADKIMKFIYLEAKKASEQLAQERSPFSNFGISIYNIPIRNASFTVIAPTGEISILANCSPGIEPNYGLVYKRKTTLAVKELISVNPVFEAIAKKEGFYSIELLEKIITNNGKANGIKEIPKSWQEVFVTALEISPEYHLKILAAFQKHVDNSVSKTINLPNNATVTDVEKIIKSAYELGCHGVTIFRDGCRETQIMNTGENTCPDCSVQLVFSEGCFHCPSCGWGKCVIG